MEPDVACMYSSFPPPLDEGSEEDDDDFGDFGRFSGITPGTTFAEFDGQVSFCQARATQTLSLGPFSNGTTRLAHLSLGDADKTSGRSVRGSVRSFCLPRNTVVCTEDLKRPVGQLCPSTACNSAAPEVNGDWTEGESGSHVGGAMDTEVFTNGFAHSAVCLEIGGPEVTGLPFLSNGGMPPGGRHLTPPGDHLRTCAAPLIEKDSDWSSEKSQETDKCFVDVVTESLSNGCEDEGTGLSHDPLSFTQSTPVMAHWEGPGIRKVGAEEKQEVGRLTAVSGDSEENQWGIRELWLQDELSDKKCSHSDRTALNKECVCFCRAPATHYDCEDFEHRDLPVVVKGNTPGVHEAGSRLTDKGFADFSQLDPASQTAFSKIVPPRESPKAGEYGDFDLLKHCEGEGDGMSLSSFPGSDSFADFSSAPLDAEPGSEWDAFGEQGGAQAGGDSWVAFVPEQRHAACSQHSSERWEDGNTAPLCGSLDICRRRSHSVSLTSRLEGLFRVSFPPVAGPDHQEEVVSLGVLLQEPRETQGTAVHWAPQDMWQHLQDIHSALGLRYRWSGSHGNKALLRSLGVDSKSVLVTGQKKPLLVEPTHSKDTEPTKETVTPISVAEKITCTAQASPVSPELSTSVQSAQEAFPPVQFDWSSSGLTNPLGGTSVLRSACAPRSRHGSFS